MHFPRTRPKTALSILLVALTTAFACADSYGAEAALRTRGIIAAARGPALRIAPHFFNTLDEVDLAVDTLAEVLGV